MMLDLIVQVCLNDCYALTLIHNCNIDMLHICLVAHGLEPSRLLCPWGFSWTRILEWVAISYSRVSSQPRIKPTSPALADGFFTLETPRKPQALY